MEGKQENSALLLLHAVYLRHTVEANQSLEKLGVVHVPLVRHGNRNGDVALLSLPATTLEPLAEVDNIHETFARFDSGAT